MPLSRPLSSIRLRVLLPVAVFLLIFGLKTFIIAEYGSDLPYWDQWPGEGTFTFQPWLERHELWRPLLTPHNEHRIAPTRLLSLGLLLAGGQWDARVQCIVNAALHAGLVALFFVWLSRRLSPPWSLAAAALFALAVAPPIAWEDLLGGFQSQYYFLIGFSLLSLKLALDHRAFSLRWCAGILCGGVAIFTMGSGMLCGLPLVLLAAGRLWQRSGRRRDHFATLIAGAAILLLGGSLYAPVAHHADLRAHTLGQFLLYAARGLSWPCPSWPWLALLLWAPWCALLVRRLRQPRSSEDLAADFLLAAGLWILLQTAAVSYSRGGGSDLPSARYGDVTGLGLLTGFASLALLATRAPARKLTYAGALYFAVAALAVGVATRAVWRDVLPSRRAEFRDHEHSVQAFILTDDPTHLREHHIPFPWPDWLRDFLRQPLMRPLLPASVRAPLKIDGFTDTDPALWFRRLRRVPPGTRWESPALPPSAGWWKIETIGDLGQPGTSLSLVSAKTHEVLARLAPTKRPGATWRAAYVPAPRESVLLRAETGPAATFAFSEPVEMSALSHGFWQLGKFALWFFFGGLALFATVLGFSVVSLLTARPNSTDSTRDSPLAN